jgi:hypothetical protein
LQISFCACRTIFSNFARISFASPSPPGRKSVNGASSRATSSSIIAAFIIALLFLTLLLRELLKLKHDDATLRDDLPNTFFISFDDVVNGDLFIIALAIIIFI